MKYIAKSDGFVGGARIRAGQVFDYEGKPGKWMAPATEDAQVTATKPAKQAPAKEQKEPATFSEMAKRDGKAQGKADNK